MNTRTRGWPARFVVGAAALVVLLVAIGIVAIAARLRAVGPPVVMAADFTLVDQNDRPFTLSGMHGHPVALFFGYAHCPDECPTTLARLAKAALWPGVPRDQRVAFITVDPRRDTPATLKRYIGLFKDDFIGLTGSSAALEPVYAAYRTPHQLEVLKGDPKDYSVSHGTTIYFVGRDGSIKGLGQFDDGIPAMAREFHDFQ